MLDREREAVAAAGRTLAAAGLAPGTSGNVSARAGELVAISATGAQLGDLRAQDVVVVDLNACRQTGARAPSSEVPLHLGLYRRFDAGAVVHVHPPVGTALACVLDELPALHYVQQELGGTVRVAPYATFGTEELATLTLDALAGRRAVLMANHGALAYADTVERAVERARLLEWCCELYWRAAAVGPTRSLTDEQLRAVAARMDVQAAAAAAG